MDKRQSAINEVRGLLRKSRDQRFSPRNRDLMWRRVLELVKRWDITYRDLDKCA